MELKSKETERVVFKEKVEGKLIKLQLRDIRAYENNAKIHTSEQIGKIRDSIQTFGYKDFIAVDENNVIIEGHGRLQALYQLDSSGSKSISVIKITDLSEEEKKAYRIAHNKIGMETDFDLVKLGKEFNSLEDTESFNDTGFNSNEITEIWDKDKEAEEDDFEEPKEAKYKIELGEIWELGNHRLMCGDSTIKSQVDALMGGVKANMVFTDPPYNVDYEGGFGRQTMAEEKKKWSKIKNDNMDKESWLIFCNDFMKRMQENTVGPVYIFMSCKELPVMQSVFTDIGGHWQSTLIWKKERFVFGMKDYKSDYEPFIYGWFDKRNWSGPQNETDIWDLSRDKPSDYVHPTQKPVELSARAMNNSTHSGDAVLDLFGGSGSTLIACEQLNRKCYMMELDPHYVSVIIERWEKLTNKKAIRLTE